MKNILFGTSLIALFFVFGCKKDSITVTPTPTDGWNLGTKFYKQNQCQRDTSSNDFGLYAFSFSNTPAIGEGWGAIFGSYPKFGGNYTISKNYLSGSGIGSNELVLFSFSFNNTNSNPLSNTYFSTCSDAQPVQVKVTITNGKITLSTPECWVRKADLTSGVPVFGTDSLKITGTMIEN